MSISTQLAGQGDSEVAPVPEFNLLKIAAVSAEMVMVTLVFQGAMSLPLALGLHFALCGSFILLVVVAEFCGLDSSSLQKFTFLTLVAGPVGSATALVDGQLRHDTQSARLKAWYDKIAPAPQDAVTLVERILDDRLVRANARLPKDIDVLLKQGSMREVQAFFASVAADGRPESTALLRSALGSSDQRIRVQAAAVSAYLRDKARSVPQAQSALPSSRKAGLSAARRNVISFPAALSGAEADLRGKRGAKPLREPAGRGPDRDPGKASDPAPGHTPGSRIVS